MLPELAVLTITLRALRGRLERARRDPEAGLTTAEWVILVAIAAGIAITVGAIIRSRVVDKANTIPLG